MKRTLPDANQNEVIEALQKCGFVVVDMHNVPAATGAKELQGFPDLLAVNPDGFTLVGDFKPARVQALLALEPDLVILPGAVILVEVKTAAGELRSDQMDWWRGISLKPLILRTWQGVFGFLGRRYD